MENLKLLISSKAIQFFKKEFGDDPYIKYQNIPGDDSFVYLIIEDIISLDIEKIAAASENFGFDEGFDAGIKHASQ